jgi:hypothetical protein
MCLQSTSTCKLSLQSEDATTHLRLLAFPRSSNVLPGRCNTSTVYNWSLKLSAVTSSQCGLYEQPAAQTHSHKTRDDVAVGATGSHRLHLFLYHLVHAGHPISSKMRALTTPPEAHHLNKPSTASISRLPMVSVHHCSSPLTYHVKGPAAPPSWQHTAPGTRMATRIKASPCNPNANLIYYNDRDSFLEELDNVS